MPIAPTVTAVAPTPNATAVPINTKIITAAFSKAMDPNTLTSTSFTLTCPATATQTGSVTYKALGSVASLTLANNLPARTTCTATITTGAKDTGGIALASNFSWTFTTGIDAAVDITAPTVSSIIPLANATGVALNSRITASFSEPMDPLTIDTNHFSLACPVGTPVAGTTGYTVSGNVATFIPNSPLPANITCTATITTGVRDVAANAMAAPFTWTFTTGTTGDTTAPTVTSTLPLLGANNVATNTQITATFSEAMAPLTFNSASFKLACPANTPVAGTVGYAVNSRVATFVPINPLPSGATCLATISTAVTDVAMNAMVMPYSWQFTIGVVADNTAPTLLSTFPAANATNVGTDTLVTVLFSEAMSPLTLTTTQFTLLNGNASVAGTVQYDATSHIATFTPLAPLMNSTTYTAQIYRGVTDVRGNELAIGPVPNNWTFTTAAAPVFEPAVPLGTVAPFGTFGGTAGMTNTGTLTLINGNIGTTATGTSAITGFHDTAGDIYTQTPANIGAVNGTIYTCTNSTTGPTSAGANAPACAIATQARLDAQTAYQALVAMPPGANPGGNLAGLTLTPGVYTAPSGSFLIQGGDLTLDAQGNANAVFVFQMSSTLGVGGPGAAFPQSIILTGGALAKNVYWQVGSAAIINAAGGGTMVGTIIAQSGVAFSTAGNTSILTLNGRALSLGAAITLVDTVINVPAP
ncbi:Ig-like domain-containing protein [Chitinimonas arctica]|uniref:Ig-like domain-containing protein n=1 Tax=Chitinimonas arctica TaxID=2594795 RepID=UPI0015D3B053|nr:Ig-like domain-containing protein [Chitinimonas arctica]